MSEFSDLVDAVSSHLSTKAELVSYYQAEYTGKGKAGWKQHIVHDLLPFTPQTGKNPAKNLEKRFDPQRLGNVEKRNAAQYEALGKQIGPLPPRGGYLVSFRGTLRISGKCTDKEREFSLLVTGNDARLLASTQDFGIVLALYGGGFEDICEIYKLEVIPGHGQSGKPLQHEAHGPTKYLALLKK